MNNTLKEFEKKDSCIICREPSEYNRDLNIDKRMYYIEGAGQLCKNCYSKVYYPKTSHKLI